MVLVGVGAGEEANGLRGRLTQGAWSIAPKGLVERTVAAATPAGRRRGLRELVLALRPETSPGMYTSSNLKTGVP